MSAPRIVIEVDFEASRPRVVLDYLNEGDGDRMRDWLGAHPEMFDLVVQAIELSRQERAA